MNVINTALEVLFFNLKCFMYFFIIVSQNYIQILLDIK